MTAHTADDGLNISIHAAREGGDGHAAKPCYTGCISIHAAREGGDHPANDCDKIGNDFNPRRP